MELNNWLSNIQDWLLPRLCPACGGNTEAGEILCAGCVQTLPRSGPACPRCATPYDHPVLAHECGTCQQHPPAYDRCVALFHYGPPIDHFVRRLKFHRELSIATVLGEWLAERLQDTAPLPDVILPIPLHATRLRERGYNQALEIAKPVAQQLGAPINRHALLRLHATAAQSDLPLEDRRRNVRGAFAVRAGNDLAGLHVALVDDVMTSGSTVQAAARCLRQAGASEISVWVVARA